MRYISSFEQIFERQGEAKRGAILLERLLEWRFGKLPEWVGERLRQATVEKSEGWFDRALDAKDLREVFGDPANEWIGGDNPTSEPTPPDVGMDELRALLAELVRRQQETDRRIRQLEDWRREYEHNRERFAVGLRELSQTEIGAGRRIWFADEDYSRSALERFLRKNFAVETFCPNVDVRKAGEYLYLDALAYSSGERKEAFIVMFHSQLEAHHIHDLLAVLNRFFKFFPVHRDKQVYGVLAVKVIAQEVKAEALQQGLYLARIHDDEFELETPEGFRARCFSED